MKKFYDLNKSHEKQTSFLGKIILDNEDSISENKCNSVNFGKN